MNYYPVSITWMEENGNGKTAILVEKMSVVGMQANFSQGRHEIGSVTNFSTGSPRPCEYF